MSDAPAASIPSIFALTNHELYLVSAREGDQDNAMIASWIMPGTLVVERPRLVAVLSVMNLTTTMIQRTGRFAVQLLAEGQHDLVPHFGLRSGRELDKLTPSGAAPVEQRTPLGLPLIGGTCGWAECQVGGLIDGGDRIVVLADISAQWVEGMRRPLCKADAFARLGAEQVAALRDKQIRDGRRDATLVRNASTGGAQGSPS